MAERLSTGCVDQSLETRAAINQHVVGTTIAFGDGTGTGGLDEITDSGSGLAGFDVGDLLTVLGSTSNDGEYEILSSVAGTIEVAAGSLTTESAGDSVSLVTARGASVADLLRNGVLALYTGTQPASADLAETGSLVCLITLSKGAFVAGADANGLNFRDAVAGVLAKDTSEVWQGDVLIDGTIGWFRFYSNAYVTGATSVGVHIDGAVATSGAELNIPNITVVTGASITVDAFNYTRPLS